MPNRYTLYKIFYTHDPISKFLPSYEVVIKLGTQKLTNGSLNLNTGLSKENCWSVPFLTL